MQNKVAKATQAFMALPVAIRTRFGNDVVNLLEFIDDPRNIDEARKLGLLKPASKEEVKAKEKAAEARAEAEAAAAKAAKGEAA